MPHPALSIRTAPGWRNALTIAALAALLILCPWGGQVTVMGAQVQTGQAVYKQECARCHGQMGEGTKKTTKALFGEKSASQLFKVIQSTMPDDDPGSCTDEEYRKVAAYIYDAFYSPDAQARLHPPRVELSHLTVGQYRSSVADLIGKFRGQSKPDGRVGLHAEYFNSRDVRRDKRVIDRLDPEVNFDFGTAGPDADADDADPDASKFNPDQFSIQWEGSVLADQTGNYEFVVRTEQALRLWVNDPKKPLIDGFVKSGQDTEYRATMFLIAGRYYPIRLQVFKGRGLNTKKETVHKPAKASVALLWKPPGRQVDGLIASRYFTPTQTPEVAVIQTPFPPDDRSYGWERGTAVSKEWFGATADAALDVAGYVDAHLSELAGVDDGASNRGEKLKAFCRSFAERAFRRPLTDAEKQDLVDRQFEGTSDLNLAVKRSVIRVMIAPEFLYPDAFDKLNSSDVPRSEQFATASRLALVLWDALPDQTLLTAAAQGKLASREQIAQQAERMIDDPRVRLKMRQFLLAWLRVDQAPELAKDAKKFPDFDANVAADLRTSLELFLDSVVSSDTSDFRQLLLSDDVFLNGRLAKFYGADLPADAGFTKVKLDGYRAGVLTQPDVLATFAYPGESSPIHRGVFMIRGLLGYTLRPPANSAFVPLPPESHPELTTRERITLQTQPESCISCHSVINPLGFPLEKFDAVGRPRETENGKAIDLSGEYETRAGPIAKFTGARELAEFLANSDEVHESFVQQMFQHLVKQPVRAYGLEKPKQLDGIFAGSGYNIHKLLVEIAIVASQHQDAALSVGIAR
jgi:mono/diheme cytochrome c family protein